MKNLKVKAAITDTRDLGELCSFRNSIWLQTKKQRAQGTLGYNAFLHTLKLKFQDDQLILNDIEVFDLTSIYINKAFSEKKGTWVFINKEFSNEHIAELKSFIEDFE